MSTPSHSPAGAGFVYLDHAATHADAARGGRGDAAVPRRARPGNPSGAHAPPARPKTALEEARETVAALLGAQPGEVVFTGGGTEADNLAVKGAAWAARADAASSTAWSRPAIEHKAVLGACDRLEREGFRVAAVAVDRRRASSTSTRSPPRSTSAPRSCR